MRKQRGCCGTVTLNGAGSVVVTIGTVESKSGSFSGEGDRGTRTTSNHRRSGSILVFWGGSNYAETSSG